VINGYAVCNNVMAGGIGDVTLTGKWAASVLKSPSDISCTYFTGLSAETTLNVNMVWYVEMVPRSTDPTYGIMVPLAKTPIACDPRAMAIYQQMARALPGGVPQTMNPSGEFWKGIVDVAKQAMPMLATLFPESRAISMASAGLTEASPFIRAILKQLGDLKGTVQRVAGQVGGIKSEAETAHVIMRPKAKKKATAAQRARANQSRNRILNGQA